MKKNLLKKAGVLASAAVIAATLASEAHAKKVRWKMHGAFGSNVAVIGPPGPRIAEAVKRMSGGDFDIKFFEPGALAGGTPTTIRSARVALKRRGAHLAQTRVRTQHLLLHRHGPSAQVLENSWPGSSTVVVTSLSLSCMRVTTSSICFAVSSHRKLPAGSAKKSPLSIS